MDADPLSLLVILRQELQHISNTLYPEPGIAEDIMTDNGLTNEQQPADAPIAISPRSPSEHEQDEEEKAPELVQFDTKTNCLIKEVNPMDVGCKIDQLIENYLTPTIKQLNAKKRKRNKKKSNVNSYYEATQPHLLPSQSLPLLHDTASPPLPFSASPPINQRTSSHRNGPSNGVPARGQVNEVIDDMSHYSEKLGTCCRRFVTSLFCGCGMFQTIGIFIVLAIFGMAFVFYRASELTLILREINHWKELSIKHVEYELTAQQKMAQINFDLDVDIDKLKEEHSHRVQMEIIEAKKSLTKDFIDKNTRTVTTTYWNFLTTETETVSQTIFSEEDIAFFQNNILYYGFNEDKAIESPQASEENIPPQSIDNNKKKESTSDSNGNQAHCEDRSCHDSFDSI